MLLKEKRMRRQQMVRALVEFQRKAVHVHQTVTIIDALHIAGVFHATTSRITRIVRVGKRMRDRRVLLKARPYRRRRFPPSLLHAETLWATTTVFQPSCGNQGAGEQGALLAKDSPERTAMKKIRKIKEMRPKVSSRLNVGTAATSITDADAQKTLNHEMAKRQKQPIHQLRILLLGG
ncbi:hypothetical protein J1605_001774 [Eschrichtius robustus]|uniref:Uncharacterized protein n=1 Tax=Eschrichtius robustus TaxID=9764 RepID=A0AB34I2L3_ESCRO|nr:hypothetical protein J1605_001774 [Eschrichtius robustus]